MAHRSPDPRRIAHFPFDTTYLELTEVSEREKCALPTRVDAVRQDYLMAERKL